MTLGLTHITANNIMVTKEEKQVNIFITLFYIWKRLFTGTLLANYNLIVRTFWYFCHSSDRITNPHFKKMFSKKFISTNKFSERKFFYGKKFFRAKIFSAKNSFQQKFFQQDFDFHQNFLFTKNLGAKIFSVIFLYIESYYPNIAQ